MMNLSLNLLALLSLVASLGDASKTFSMRMYRRDRSAMIKRDTLPVDIGNAQVLDGLGLYYVNASVGTPPQLVQLQIDTGSSDVWFFGPDSCDSTTSPCVGGICKSKFPRIRSENLCIYFFKQRTYCTCCISSLFDYMKIYSLKTQIYPHNKRMLSLSSK